MPWTARFIQSSRGLTGSWIGSVSTKGCLGIIAERRPKAIGTEFVLAPKPMNLTNRRRIRLPLYMAALL